MPTLADLRKQYPSLSSLDDQDAVDVVHGMFYADLPVEEVANALGVKPRPEKTEPRGALGVAKDAGISLLKGAIGVPEAAVGLADLVTGGRAGQAAEAVGFRPKEAKAILDEGYSQEQKDAFGRVQAAQGFGDTLMEAVRNPSVVAHSVLESLPLMGAGGVVARGGMALAPRLSPLVAGAIGEGAAQAGSAAESMRQESPDGTLNGRQAGAAVLSGVADTGLALLGGKIAKSLGIADVDTMLAGAARDPGAAKGLTRRVLEGAVSEGLLEELPQSVQEQVLQNYGMGKPLDEGVDQAAVLGMLSGAAMGGGANVVSAPARVVEPAVVPQPIPEPIPEPNGPLSRAANAAGPQAVAAAAGMQAPAAEQPQEPALDPVVERIKKLPEGDRQEALAAYGILNREDAPKGVRQYNSRLLDELLAKLDEKPAAESSDPASLLAGQMGNDPVQQALAARRDEEVANQNLTAWMSRAQPMALDHAQELLQAATEKGYEMTVVPHGSGQGYTLVPSKWITPAMRNQVATALPMDTAPTGVIRADARGNAAPETGAQAIDARNVAAAQAAERQRKNDLGLTPDVEAMQAGKKRQPLPTVQTGDVTLKSGQPFKNKGAAARAQKAAGGGDVVQVQGGWVVRTQAAAPAVQQELEAGNVGERDGTVAAAPADGGRGGDDAGAGGGNPAAAGVDARGGVVHPAGAPATAGETGAAVRDTSGEPAAAVADKPASGEAVPNERVADGGGVPAKSVRDLLEGTSFGPEGFRNMDVERQRSMVATMRDAIHDLKVRRAVVRLVPASVMNELGGKKGTAKLFLDDPAVLHDALADSETGFSVATARLFDALREAPAAVRAKVLGRLGEAGGTFSKTAAAEVTGDLKESGKGAPVAVDRAEVLKPEGGAVTLAHEVDTAGGATEADSLVGTDVAASARAEVPAGKNLGGADREDGSAAAAGSGRHKEIIADTGEKIGGARKDKWAERGLNVADLDDMSDTEGAELAVKKNVWVPDYDAIAEAAEPVTAAMVKVVYDSLAAKPKADTPQGRRDYVRAMQAVRKVFGAVTSVEEAKNAYIKLRAELGVAQHPATTPEGKEARRVMFSVYKGRSDPFVFDYNALARAKKLAQDGFPAKGEPWKKRLAVRGQNGRNLTAEGVRIYTAESAGLGTPLTEEQLRGDFFLVRAIGTGKTLGYFTTKADAEAGAKTIYERDMKGGKDEKPEPQRPHLDLKREGLPQRIDRDVTTHDFINRFGFRAIEWGNWSAQDERQRLLNMAYDGLADLAEIMGVPPQAMSLNGTLGMAFGARGTGKALAHYEPGKLVINMTKLRGGGSLAHEWAHALDHYFGELQQTDAYKGKARGASGWYDEGQYNGVPITRMERQADGSYKKTEKMRLANLRPELAAALDTVMSRLFQAQITKAEMLQQLQAGLAQTEAMAASMDDPKLKKVYENSAESQRQNIEELREDPDDKTYPRGRSEYAKEAQKLSGKSSKGYWVRPTEMFARAFESWVFDRVVAMGARSDYLVHGVEEGRFAGGGYKGNPYPVGKERAQINAAFEKMAATIKTKPGEDGKVVMFSRTEATQKVYEQRIDDLFAGEKARIGTKVLDRSDLMGLLGYPQAPLVLNESHLREGMTAHPEMTAAIWKKVPDWLDNPAAAYLNESMGHKGRIVVLAPETVAGYPVLMVIEPQAVDPKAPRKAGQTQLLVTAFAKTTGVVPLAGAARSGRLLYLNKENAQQAGRDGGVQFPTHDDQSTGRRRILSEKHLDAHRRQSGSSGGTPGFSRADGTKVEGDLNARAKAVQEFVDSITAKWANAPEIVVVRDMQDERVPEVARETDKTQRVQGSEGEVHGFHYQGKVYLVAASLSDANAVLETLAHEAVGHFGLRGVFGDRLAPILKQIVTMRKKEVLAKAEAYGMPVTPEAVRAELGKGATDADVKKVIDKRLQYAAEEVLAEMAQVTPTLGFVRRAVAAIRTFLRDTLGLKLQLSDDEIIRSFIIPAREFVVRGEGTGATGKRETVHFHRAFHGSPHDFDAFTTDKIGSGEGNQAFGWGLYFAENQGIADGYRKNLSYRDVVQQFREALPDDAGFDEALDAAKSGDLPKPMADVIKALAADDWLGFDYPAQAISAAFKELSAYDASPALEKAVRDYSGKLYQVDIPDHVVADMLLWDKPINQQPPKVREALLSTFSEAEKRRIAQWKAPGWSLKPGEDPNVKYEDAIEAGTIYNRLAADLGSLKAASEALQRAGITGIRYLDEPSRPRGGPRAKNHVDTHNLVVFNDKNVTITHKDGTPVTKAERAAFMEGAQGGDGEVNFSRGAAGNTLAADLPGETIKTVTVEDIHRRVGNTMAHYRGLALQALGRRQLVDIYGEDIPQLGSYSKLVQQMDADRNESAQQADDIATRWGKLKDHQALAELMHEATIAQIDPDKPLVQGDDRATHQRLKTRFDALSPEAKTIWRESRDMYEEHYSRVRAAIRERIERSELASEAKARMLERMDGDFFDKIRGVYFPLARFGDYVVVVKDAKGKAVNVSRAETINQAEATREELRKQYPAKDGFSVGKVLKSAEFNAARDSVSRGFMQELTALLEQKGMDQELQDSINQLYLSSLPDLSWAKHGIHRKNMPGFSQDARRAFAANMFHGARYLARLRYADLMANELQQAQRYVDAREGDDQYDSVKARQVLDEMDRRHELLMNPKSNPVATALTSFGYIFHLGLSPASAFTNLSGTALVAYPVMGAKWGFTKAGAALAEAARQAAASSNDLSRVLKGDEKAAFDEAVRRGTIDVTNAHDLAGIASGDDAKLSWKMRPVMKAASFMFHHAEKFNRQVTFIAAYRLARAKGEAHQQAFDTAEKVTYDTHFDYSASNRPRVMQGNWQRVILLFKQYSQNMIYMLARNAYQAVKALKPQERAEARKALAGLLVTHAAAAGVLGLPLVGMLLSAASFIGGDDDEPWDAETALRNVLADTFGQKPAEVMARGLSRLTPWDISGRVGLDKLIFPDVQEGLEGQKFYEAAAVGALGPVAGIGLNVAKGMGEIGKGEWARGIEDMMPAALRGPMKALRYGREGAIDKTGVPIKEEVGVAGLAGQVLGFSPSEVRLASEVKGAVLKADKAVEHRRAGLLRQYAQAVINGDTDHAQEVRAEIQVFNQKQRERAISNGNLMQSVRNRRRRIDEAEDGVYLPRSHRAAREAGRFGAAQSE